MTEKIVMYADTTSGEFDMTWEDVLSTVTENPFFSDEDVVCLVGDDGSEYTGAELLRLANVKNALQEA